MMKFETLDGTVFEGHSYEEIVEIMSAGKLERTDPQRYMKAVARRVHESFPHITIGTESALRFVEDLVTAGILRPAYK